METIDLKIYQILRCGYYSRKQDVVALDDQSDLFTNLKTWISGQNIVNNCTYSGSDASGSDKTLCVSIIKDRDTKDQVITLWSGIDAGDKNTVGAISSRANPENIDVEERRFSEDSVPGYPIYFYVIPEYKLLTPIKINGSKNGIVGFNKYMNGFLQRYSKFVNYETDETGDRKITHFGKIDSEERGYFPMFKYRNWQRADIGDFLREKRDRIKRVIKKDITMRSRHGGILKKLFGFQSATDERIAGVRFKYELDITPSAEELESYIDECDQDQEGDLDYGFKIGSDVHWIGHSIQKHTFSADIRRRGGVIYSGASLLEVMKGFRSRIIDNLSAEEEEEDDDD